MPDRVPVTAARPAPAPSPPAWCEALSDAVLVFDRERRVTYVNAAGARLVGCPAGDVLGRTVPELVAAGVGFFGANPRRSDIVHRVLPHVLAGRSLSDDETTVQLSDGSWATYSWRLDPVDQVGAVLVMRDMTELSNATFQAAPVGMLRVRGDGEVLEVNSALRGLLGLPGQGPLLRPLRELIHPDDRAFHDAMFREFVEGGRHRYQAERRVLANDGSVVWCHLTMTVPFRHMLTDERWFDRVVGVVEDVTDRKRLERELRARNTELARLARTDPLTGLYNRRHGEERLVEEASEARRHGTELSVVLVDVDRFKLVNDRFGHTAGDDLLRAVAELVRESKRAEDVCCRWGGEEFLLILPHTGLTGAVVFAERLRQSVRAQPVPLADTAVPVTVSAGVSGGGTDVAELLRRAEMALYAAKAAGRDRVAAEHSTVDGARAA